MELTPEQANELRAKCKERIDLREALNRLNHNPDFAAIVDEYTVKEAVRLTHLLGEPTFNLSDKREIQRTEIKESLIGVARFMAFLRNIYRMAEQAEKTLDDLRKAEAESDNN